MGDSVKYKTGVNDLGSSMGGIGNDAFANGFSDVTPKAPVDAWSFDSPKEDGSSSDMEQYRFQDTGACGRPHGNER